MQFDPLKETGNSTMKRYGSALAIPLMAPVITSLPATTSVAAPGGGDQPPLPEASMTARLPRSGVALTADRVYFWYSPDTKGSSFAYKSLTNPNIGAKFNSAGSGQGQPVEDNAASAALTKSKPYLLAVYAGRNFSGFEQDAWAGYYMNFDNGKLRKRNSSFKTSIYANK